MSEKVKIYVTKWCLTRGIQEMEGELWHTDHFTLFPPDGYPSSLIRGEFHKYRHEAVEKAKLMRTRKIASLRKQINNLEAMDFE